MTVGPSQLGQVSLKEQVSLMVIKNVYEHPTLTRLDIPRHVLANLLRSCSREAPLRSSDGKLYLQIEEVAMGSPSGPTFANFCMGKP